MVLTLKAKEGLEHDNPFQLGQTGLIGNPAARKALDDADAVLMLGTDFPYRDWYPKGKAVVQVDARGEHIGRRTSVEVGVVGDAGASPASCSGSSRARGTARTSTRPRALRGLARAPAPPRRPAHDSRA